MKFNFCVCIPVYNHAGTVGDIVRRSLMHSTAVFVCDDGSSDGSGSAAKEAGAEILIHDKNQGKGIALKTLLAHAQQQGFRYAICLDADGQHFPEDIPVVLNAIEAHPNALVAGSRDLAKANAPGISQFGRKFSNFWVWFECGAKVEDSQCGFRAYPLPETLRVMGLRSKYDFEVEILLRAAWAGIEICSVPVQVTYPTDRITHFQKFDDNVRISLLNAASCFRQLAPWRLAPLIRETRIRPGLSLHHIRNWVWLGRPAIWARILAVLFGCFHPAGIAVSGALGLGVAPALMGWAFATATKTISGPRWHMFAVAAILAALYGYAELIWRKSQLRKGQIA